MISRRRIDNTAPGMRLDDLGRWTPEVDGRPPVAISMLLPSHLYATGSTGRPRDHPTGGVAGTV